MKNKRERRRGKKKGCCWDWKAFSVIQLYASGFEEMIRSTVLEHRQLPESFIRLLIITRATSILSPHWPLLADPVSLVNLNPLPRACVDH